MESDPADRSDSSDHSKKLMESVQKNARGSK